jgi:Ca2+-binding EF-hand superfamily protein
MGNMLEVSDDNYLGFEVHDPFTYLINCIINLVSYSDIIKLQKKIAKLDTSEGFFVPVSDLKQLFKGSPIQGRETLVEANFVNKRYQKFNVMEVIAGLIVYSACSVEDKVQLALDVFDLDGNQVITNDEMVIMCISFLRGIGIMVQAPLKNKVESEALANEAFHLADSIPDGMITYDE